MKLKIWSIFVKIIINQNYFVYENHYYENKKGLTIGAPLSLMLSVEIYLQQLEENVILTPKSIHPTYQLLVHVCRRCQISVCWYCQTNRPTHATTHTCVQR